MGGWCAGPTHLRVYSHILKKACNPAKPLVKVMAFFQRMRDRLKNLLILFRVNLMDLLYGANIILQIHNGVFPSLQPLCKYSSGLATKSPLLAWCWKHENYATYGSWVDFRDSFVAEGGTLP
jgi:hypothetical protein